jgi:hypothetical protein
MRFTTAASAIAVLVLCRSASAQPAPPEPVPPPVEPPPSAQPLLPTTPSEAPPAPAPRTEAESPVVANEKRFADDEARIKKLEDLGGGILKNLTIQGYAQVQFLTQSVNAAASPNLQAGSLPEGIGSNDVVAKADGTTTNTTLFRLRRTRLRVKYEVDFLRVFLQFDPFPTGGPSAPQGTIARNAEVTGIARWTKSVRTEVGAGLFEVPFRAELVESSMYRPFLERTWTSQNLFPTERDLGVHARTFALEDRLMAEVGIFNGQRLGEPRFVELADLNRSKDFNARFLYKLGPITFSASGYLGRGATVDAKALRLKNFPRNGVNVGLQYADKLLGDLGETRAYGELMFGQNMDTGVRYPFAVPAIPTNVKDDVRNLNERGLYIRVEQDLGKIPFAGFRYDMYTPDSSIKNNARDTYTLMAGVKFTKLLRIINEASYIIDNAHAGGAPPPSKHIFQYSLWMQGSFY